MLPTKFWAEMSWRDFAAADMAKSSRCCRSRRSSSMGRICRSASTRSSTRAISRARSRASPTHLPVLFLPVQAIGKSNEHIEFPGTLTFSIGDDHPRLDRDRRERRARRAAAS